MCSVIRVLCHQGALSSRCSVIRVHSHQGALSSGCSLIRVLCHQGALSSGCSVIRVLTHQGALSSGCSVIRVHSHQGALSSGFTLIRVLCHQGFHCSFCSILTNFCQEDVVWWDQPLSLKGIFRCHWLQLSFCFRQINKMRPGGRKSVIYRATCGRRLRSIEEVDDFLSITDSQLFIDHFCFDPWLHVHTDFVPVKVGHGMGSSCLLVFWCPHRLL